MSNLRSRPWSALLWPGKPCLSPDIIVYLQGILTKRCRRIIFRQAGLWLPLLFWQGLSAPNHKSQIASDFKSQSPKSQEFPPNRCLGQLKSHFQIARFVIWTSVQIAARIAMPISYTISQKQWAFLRRFTLSQIASDLRFAIRITNRNRSQIARFGALRTGPSLTHLLQQICWHACQ